MTVDYKKEDSYKTIGEITKELGLVDPKTGALQTHTLRYWETQFKQIKPSIKAGKRRYYSKKDVQIIKKIKFLLKDKGLTIKGAKKIMKGDSSALLDDDLDIGLYKQNLKDSKTIKERIIKISKIVKELKDLK